MRQWEARQVQSLTAVLLILRNALLLTSISPPLPAITSGPTQPEVKPYSPLSVGESVDPFTGDFSYTIPLMDVGGHPITLTYKSGVTPDQEAGMVGLGWSINTGSIVRDVRGIPDDFQGDGVERQVTMRDNETFGGNLSVGLEIFGTKIPGNPALKVGVKHNSHTGLGLDAGLDSTLVTIPWQGGKLGLNAGLGVSSDSGLAGSASLSFNQSIGGRESAAAVGGSIGTTITSREGLQEVDFGVTASTERRSGKQTISSSQSMGSSIALKSEPWIPEISSKQKQSGVMGRLTLGGAVFGLNGHVGGSFYWSKQETVGNQPKIPAYGYLYSSKAGSSTRVIHDFLRERSTSFRVEQPRLSPTQLTYDLWSATASGLTAQFRPHRSDIGVVFDPLVQSELGPNGNLGVELGGGNLFKFGGDFSVPLVSSQAGKWSQENPIGDRYGFRSDATVQFRRVGELTKMPHADTYRSFREAEPVRVVLRDQKATNELETSQGVRFAAPALNDAERSPGAVQFSYLTAKQAAIHGLEKEIRSYDAAREIAPYAAIPRESSYRLGHHISEIMITKDDGTRYVFGIPVYNIDKCEIQFASGAAVGRILPATGTWNPTAIEASSRNGEYYSETRTPAYAHSFLLTAILSPEYVDISGDGPSADDLGVYTKFNYTRLYPVDPTTGPCGGPGQGGFRWRTPYQGALALINESDPSASVSHFTAGEKEIWYPHSVETRNYLANFTYTERQDAMSAPGNSGTGSGAQPLRKLDHISLFNRNQLLSDPVRKPLREAWFAYDYSLCRGVPNSGAKAKLTLRLVSFSSLSSKRGLLSPYQFTYGARTGASPPYDPLAADRWGSYQSNRVDGFSLNERFPYTKQGPRDAATWELTSIQTPSGGAVRAEYEQDDYAYVQDERAMMMVPVVATYIAGSAASPRSECFTPSGQPILSRHKNNRCYLSLYGLPSAGAEAPRSKLYFNLLTPTRDPTLLQEYLDGVNELYVNALVSVNKGEPFQSESIQTFLPLAQDPTARIGFDETSARIVGTETLYARAWVAVDAAGGPRRHPLTVATWQHVKLEMPRVAFREDRPVGDFGENVGIALTRMFERIRDGFGEFDNRMWDEKVGCRIEQSRSLIRLAHPSKRKLGGGSRVRRLTVDDQWNRATGGSEPSRTYTSEYDYTIEDTVGGVKTRISSGVAANEPETGGDESPLNQPDWYESQGNRFFQPRQEGTFFLPTPQVGYRRVTVKTVNPHPDRRGTGSIVHEFFTAKDHPTIFRRTEMDRSNREKWASNTPLLTFSKDQISVSQGFSVELNDMHGKPKAVWTYRDDGTLLGGREFVYRMKADQSGLDNAGEHIVEMTSSGLQKSTELVGMTSEMVIDAREHSTSIEVATGQINSESFLAGILPILVLVPLPSYSRDDTRFRAITTTKEIHRFGVLSAVVEHANGGALRTENHVLDGETGAVIMTRTQDEHKNWKYVTNVPGYYQHAGMGGAWRNEGASLGQVEVGALGFWPRTDSRVPLTRGDELDLGDRGGSDPRAWVLDARPDGVVLIDRQGNHVPAGSYVGRVLRSGYRNMQSLSAGHVTTMDDPWESSFRFRQVLDTAAAEYDEHWQTYQPYTLPTRHTVSQRAAPLPSAITELQRDLKAFINHPRIDVRVVNERRVPLSSIAVLIQPAGRPIIAASTDSAGYVSRQVECGSSPIQVGIQVGGKVVPGSPFDLDCGMTLTVDAAVGAGAVPVITASGSVELAGNIESDLWTGTLPRPDGSHCRVRLRLPFGTISQQDVLRIIDQQQPLTLNAAGTCGQGSFVLKRANGSVVIEGETDCSPLTRCEGATADPGASSASCQQADMFVNPYVAGILGTWRLKRNWVYLTERLTNPRPAMSGAFKSFEPFWSRLPDAPRQRAAAWQWQETTTIIDPFGRNLEGVNPLGHYTAARHGFGFSVVTASVKNSRLTESAFEGFEDYAYQNVPDTNRFGERCERRQVNWRFPLPNAEFEQAVLDSTVGHSGRHSLRLAAGVVSGISNLIRAAGPEPPCASSYITGRYRLQECEMLGPFRPTASPPVRSGEEDRRGRYLVTAWVRTGTATMPDVPPRADAVVEIDLGGRTVQFASAGPLIDGWRQVQGEFEIPPGTTEIVTRLRAGAQTAWFDDVRIQPFDAIVESYVYDSHDIRLRATLDAGHFAKFYEYDEDGNLARVKMETTKGVLTVKEVSSAAPKLR